MQAPAATKTSQAAQTTVKKPSHKPSITGIVLSILSIVSSGLANFLLHMKYTPTGPTTGSIDREVGHAVATGTTSVVGALLGVPFLVGGIVLGALAILFIALRVPKLRASGYILSIIFVAVAVWAIATGIAGFDYIKADPVE